MTLLPKPIFVILAFFGSFATTRADMQVTMPENGSFSTLAMVLETTGLMDDLNGPGPFTIFGPPNQAFDDLPPDLLECLLREKHHATLEEILQYHVVPGAAVSSDDMVHVQSIATLLAGASLTVDSTDFLRINSATVLGADLRLTNGIFHIINSVLIPPGIDLNDLLAGCQADSTRERVIDIPSTAVVVGKLNSFVTTLAATNLVEVLSAPQGPFVVFAPTDDAFAALPEGVFPCLLLKENLSILENILRYHIVEDATFRSTDFMMGGFLPTLLDRTFVEVELEEMLKINDSKVVEPDILASNGVIRLIDTVLIPPGLDVEAFSSTCPDMSETKMFLLALELFILGEAVSSADLVDGIISDPSIPVTLFAPTDEAFALLPDLLVAYLLEDVFTLSTLLLYHIVEGSLLSKDLGDGLRIPTVNGDRVTVGLANGLIKINDATIVDADNALGTRFVVHVIDSVLVPSNIDFGAYLESQSDFSEIEAFIGSASGARTGPKYCCVIFAALIVAVLA